MVGAGFMGRGVANQVVNHVTGMRMSAIYARRLEQAAEAYAYATPGLQPVVARTQAELDAAVERGAPVITDDPLLLCRSPHLDALMDVTGAIELGAQVALASFEHRKHLVLMNAELDATPTGEGTTARGPVRHHDTWTEGGASRRDRSVGVGGASRRLSRRSRLWRDLRGHGRYGCDRTGSRLA
jgi:hypothetical protein